MSATSDGDDQAVLRSCLPTLSAVQFVAILVTNDISAPSVPETICNLCLCSRHVIDGRPGAKGGLTQPIRAAIPGHLTRPSDLSLHPGLRPRDERTVVSFHEVAWHRYGSFLSASLPNRKACLSALLKTSRSVRHWLPGALGTHVLGAGSLPPGRYWPHYWCLL
jgi:hypothetical protein